MDWTLAISRNRDALLRIIAALYALAGVANGAQFTHLPVPIYRTIMRIVRPAESAVRRLIIIVAHGLVCAVSPSRNCGSIATIQKAGTKTFAVFPLIDPLKRLTPQQAVELFDDEMSNDDDSEELEPTKSAFPRISMPGFLDPVFALPVKSSPNDLINAAHLSRRLCALHRALSNLPAQAKRLARWQMRRDLALKSRARKPFRLSPFRPGSAPGARRTPKHEIDYILKECHALAFDRMADTS